MAGHRRQPDRCLTPWCEGLPKSCGLCSRCHQAAARLIRSGLASESEMVDAGIMLLPSFRGQRMGRPPARFRRYALQRLSAWRAVKPRRRVDVKGG